MKKKIIAIGIIGIFLITGLASVASAGSYYEGWVSNITIEPRPGGGDYISCFSLVGFRYELNDQGTSYPYIFKQMTLILISIIPGYLRLAILLARGHLNMPLFVNGVIVE